MYAYESIAIFSLCVTTLTYVLNQVYAYESIAIFSLCVTTLTCVLNQHLY